MSTKIDPRRAYLEDQRTHLIARLNALDADIKSERCTESNGLYCFVQAHTVLSKLAFPATWLFDRIHRLGGGPKTRISKRLLVILVGLVIMLFGVVVAKASHMFTGTAMIVVDAIGYGLHALGAAPLVKYLAELLSVEV